MIFHDAAVVRVRAADDVVGDHAGDVPVLLFRHFGPVSGTEQSLFFSGDRDENESRVPVLFRHDTRHLHDGGYAGSIVIRAGRVGGGVHDVGDPRVVMTGHDINAIARFRLRPAQGRDDVDDLDRLRIAFAGRLSEIVHRYFETAAVLFAVTLELRLNPAARRADAAGIALYVGKGVPRPKADELPNRRLDILRGDLGEDR